MNQPLIFRGAKTNTRKKHETLTVCKLVEGKQKQRENLTNYLVFGSWDDLEDGLNHAFFCRYTMNIERQYNRATYSMYIYIL